MGEGGLYDEDEYYIGGLYYNGFAIQYLVQHQDTLIPGWHVATNDDWINLGNFINADAFDFHMEKTRTWGVAYQLKSTFGWIDENKNADNGTDYYGLTVVPAGWAYYDSNKNDLYVDGIEIWYEGYVARLAAVDGDEVAYVELPNYKARDNDPSSKYYGKYREMVLNDVLNATNMKTKFLPVRLVKNR